MKTIIRPAIILFALLTVITGLIYPLLITEVGKVFFPESSSGRLIYIGDRLVGSELIGQSFADVKYFWSRPSATAPMPYNASASSGSNLGPLNTGLTDLIKSRIEKLKLNDSSSSTPIPVDLVTSSASGLDPDISAAAALFQVPRVSKSRNLSPSAVIDLVQRNTEHKWMGWFGEERVNVLKLNLALDQLKQ